VQEYAEPVVLKITEVMPDSLDLLDL